MPSGVTGKAEGSGLFKKTEINPPDTDGAGDARAERADRRGARRRERLMAVRRCKILPWIPNKTGLTGL
jgi:hypothetical protein